jgi:multicomponent Na+:H+ antiporter subunit D
MTQWQRLLGSLNRYHGTQGILARSWPTGSMALWAAVVLGISLLMFFV